MARKKWTDTYIDGLKPQAKRHSEADPLVPGHYVRVTPNGVKTFAVMTRDPNGVQVLHTIGQFPVFSVEKSRELAKDAIVAIKTGTDRARAETFRDVADEWFQRYVLKKEILSHRAIRSALDAHVIPELGGREFTGITRSDVTKLLDRIEEDAGPCAADAVLAHIRSIMSWYATRHDDYVSKVIKGMRRSDPGERARDRILDDDELRALWLAAELNGTFGALIRLCLLTGQRQGKISALRWDEVDLDTGIWTIARASKREKGTAIAVQLPEEAISIIKGMPRFVNNPHVFAARSGRSIVGWSQYKKFFGKKHPLKAWRLHDLRRTARSLLSRAGVRPDIAERVLGYARPRIEATYDRYSYDAEKAYALKKLAGLLDRIVRPVANLVEHPRMSA